MSRIPGGVGWLLSILYLRLETEGKKGSKGCYHNRIYCLLEARFEVSVRFLAREASSRDLKRTNDTLRSKCEAKLLVQPPHPIII